MPKNFQSILKNRNFIQQNLDKNPSELALKFPDKKEAILQIAARQKIRKKLPEWYQNLDLIFPEKLALEQATSEAVAKLKSSLIKGKKLLDITGGLGVDSYYFSKNFNETIYIEKQKELAKIAQWNFGKLDADILVKNEDGISALKNSDADVVYIDPHRRDSQNRKMVSLTDCEPNVLQHLDLFIKNGLTFYIKTSPFLDLRLTISDLRFVVEIWVISHRNECKEVGYVLNQKSSKNISVKTFNILENSVQGFKWVWDSQKNVEMEFSKPENFLYEPNASVLKSGGQDLAAQKFSLKKLHPNSHFYTSEKPETEFPGKIFSVEEILKPFDKSLKSKRLNVISRNFPAKADAIEKRLKLKSSDRDFLLATTLFDNTKIFIRATLLSF